MRLLRLRQVELLEATVPVERRNAMQGACRVERARARVGQDVGQRVVNIPGTGPGTSLTVL